MLLRIADYRHLRTSSAGSRAARAAKVSAFKRAECADGVSRMDHHHSAGMRSRCHHLRTAAAPAPISEANASGESQSPITERKDAMWPDMPIGLGQSVLDVKAILSHDDGTHLYENRPMADRMSETEEKLAFIGRVKRARMARYDTQKPMCTILGIDQGTYKQYETRTPLPHRLIPKFCAATGVDMEWLLTGEGKGPVEADVPPPQKRPRKLRRANAA